MNFIPNEGTLISDSPGNGSLDLATLARGYHANAFSPQEVTASVLRRVGAYPDPAVWIHLLGPEATFAQARDVEKRRMNGEFLPLYGVPFAIKDNLDVAGHPTTAGCAAFAYLSERTAPVVERLLQAGAILVGKTNMDQFGTGLAGDRSPYGACRNVFDRAYISGGSSSGSAVAVAAGLAGFALGTDTAGSGRVPAGCNNIVGLKPTLGALSNEGVVPACCSLDCVSIFALTADDALAVWRVAASGGRDLAPTPVPPACSQGFAFAVPRPEDREFYGDWDQAALFEQALGRLEEMGGRPMAVDYGPFRETALLLYEGPWVAERLAWLGDFLRRHPTEVHPVTREVIESGTAYSAVDVFRGSYRLRVLRELCLTVFDHVDFLVVPTMPTVPRLEDVQADSRGWSRRLGHYTNFVNLLGLAAVAVPAGFTPGGLPGGITLIGAGGSEARLCAFGMAWQRRLGLPLGATGQPIPDGGTPREGPPAASKSGSVRLAVAGAHLFGQPLHPDLRRSGACFVRACRTAAGYRFLALMNLEPPRPGLLRDDRGAGAVQVEVYDLPVAGFGQLVASVNPPLAIGTIQLEDGESVKGFLCESWAAATARDITDFGGWVAFRDRGASRPDPRRPGKKDR